MGTLAYALYCLFSYKKGLCLSDKEAFKAVFDVLTLYEKAIGLLKPVACDASQKATALSLMKELQHCSSLFLTIAQEAKITSDLLKLDALLSGECQSEVVAKFLQEQRSIQAQHSSAFDRDRSATAEILAKTTCITIALFQALDGMHPEVMRQDNYAVLSLINLSLENLNIITNLKGFAALDCQGIFLKNDGVRALFNISTLLDQPGLKPDYGLEAQRKFGEIQKNQRILF